MEKVRSERNDIGKKHNYPLTRTQRITATKKDGSKYNSKHRTKMAEMQMKLMGYAPAHSAIYTHTYNKSRCARYQYVDVFCINNNRLFKITKIVAYIMGFEIPKNNKTDKSYVPYGVDCMRVRTYKENDSHTREEIVEIEANMIKDLSIKIFGVDNSYFHESISVMTSEFKRTVDKVENHVKKSYIVKL